MKKPSCPIPNKEEKPKGEEASPPSRLRSSVFQKTKPSAPPKPSSSKKKTEMKVENRLITRGQHKAVKEDEICTLLVNPKLRIIEVVDKDIEF